jgi:hypothetical protein
MKYDYRKFNETRYPSFCGIASIPYTGQGQETRLDHVDDNNDDAMGVEEARLFCVKLMDWWEAGGLCSVGFHYPDVSNHRQKGLARAIARYYIVMTSAHVCKAELLN